MRIEADRKLDFRDVLIRPKRSTLSSRAEVELARSYTWLNSGRTWQGIPLLAANMDTVGTIPMARALAAHHCNTVLHKFVAHEDVAALYADAVSDVLNHVWLSLGTSDAEFEKQTALMGLIADKAGQEALGHVRLCLDIANGYQENFGRFIGRCRSAWPDMPIMAGNVVTGEIVEQLLLSGADIVKCGIGGGSVCTTRKMTGVGYPQLSTVIECADAAHGLGGHIVSDGGCTVPGDIAKAFGGGADFVMLGGMLAGHDECDGQIIDGDDLFSADNAQWQAALAAMSEAQRQEISRVLPGGKQMLFYGMSSDTAMTRNYGGVASYRASEGKTVRVPYRGPVAGTVQEILGGLRSACTYVGAKRLKELSKRTTFVHSSIQTNDVFGKS